MLMYRVVPEGSCPRCGHKQFLVREFQSHLYLTNRDGEVIDAKDEGGFCVGCVEHTAVLGSEAAACHGKCGISFLGIS